VVKTVSGLVSYISNGISTVVNAVKTTFKSAQQAYSSIISNVQINHFTNMLASRELSAQEIKVCDDTIVELKRLQTTGASLKEANAVYASACSDLSLLATDPLAEFGFGAREIRIMHELRDRIDVVYADKPMRERDAIYTKLIGSMQYNSTMWKFTIGSEVANTEDVITNILGISADDYLYLRYKVRVQNQIASGGDEITLYDDLEDANKLLYKKVFEEAVQKNVTDEQFEEWWDNLYYSMWNKGDFAHLSITLTTHLYSDYKDLSNIENFASNLATFFMGGSEAVHELAGWLGDSTLPAGKKRLPILGNDDYIADLDSVNIYSIMRDKSDISYTEAFQEYYASLANGGNRAEIFLQGTPIVQVKNDIFNRLFSFMAESPFTEENIYGMNDYLMGLTREMYPDTYNFIRNLEERTNTIVDYVNLDDNENK
jgi:hypothetical protein